MEPSDLFQRVEAIRRFNRFYTQRIGVLQEAAARGLSVPGDLSVVGFDGIDAGAWTSPALTTMEQPIEEIAETAVNALRTLIAEPEKPLPDYSFRPRLKLRESTSAPLH